MYKNILLLSAIILFMQCGSTGHTSGFTLQGKIDNAANLKASLTQSTKSGNTKIGTSDIDGEGTFEIHLENGIEAGIYSFQVGKQATNLIFTGEEKQVSIQAKDVKSLQQYEYQIEGSQATDKLIDIFSKLKNKELDLNGIKELVKDDSYPIVSLYAALMSTRGSDQYADMYADALANIKEKYGESNKTYQVYKDAVNQMQRRNANKLKVGDPAPEIALENPEGKVYKLSDLKGKIVLLDFWASWCRPCRMANPHVVEMYDKYHDKGFTVYSVSLDGLDSRTKKRLGNDDERIKSFLDQQKKRWEQAIEKDNLKWDYHVSDLKKWESVAAAAYGVSSIPRTFLLDEEGKIAAINPRNNLESEIQKLIN